MTFLCKITVGRKQYFPEMSKGPYKGLRFLENLFIHLSCLFCIITIIAIVVKRGLFLRKNNP